MSINEIAEKAVEMKNQEGLNCTQAVTLALSEETDMSKEQLRQISAGFGAGMGNLEATCGALIGAGMIAGLKTEGKGTMKEARSIQESFRDKCGAIKCKDLKTVTDGKPLCPCDDCVRNAVISYGEVFNIA